MNKRYDPTEEEKIHARSAEAEEPVGNLPQEPAPIVQDVIRELEQSSYSLLDILLFDANQSLRNLMQELIPDNERETSGRPNPIHVFFINLGYQLSDTSSEEQLDCLAQHANEIKTYVERNLNPSTQSLQDPVAFYNFLYGFIANNHPAP